MAKVLIIENNDLGFVINLVLQEAGFDCLHLTTISSVDEVKSFMPDVVIVHQRLRKDFTGSDLIKALKQDEDTYSVKTILTSINLDIKERAKECGADDYLEKPFDNNELLKMVECLSAKP